MTASASFTPSETLTPSMTFTPSITPSLTDTPKASETPTPTDTATTTGPVDLSARTPTAPEAFGLFRAAESRFYLNQTIPTTAELPALQFALGFSGEVPLAGDWDGDGVDTVGFFRVGEDGRPEFVFAAENVEGGDIAYRVSFGEAGDMPLVGDWDGDGRDGIGVYRPSTGLIYMKNALNDGATDLTVRFGQPGDVLLAGDWDGDGYDAPGLYRPREARFMLVIGKPGLYEARSVAFGTVGSTPVVGDWNGDGRDGIGVADAAGVLYLRNDALSNGEADLIDLTRALGQPNDVLISGQWVRRDSATPTPTVEVAPPFSIPTQ